MRFTTPRDFLQKCPSPPTDKSSAFQIPDRKMNVSKTVNLSISEVWASYLDFGAKLGILKLKTASEATDSDSRLQNLHFRASTRKPLFIFSRLGIPRSHRPGSF